MEVSKYIGHQFQSSCGRTPEYAEFEKQCKRELKTQCKEAGINLHRFNSNHFQWSAVLEKDGKFVYVSLPDVRFESKWYYNVLIRTMAHAEDWTGGSNKYCLFGSIGKIAAWLLKNAA